MDTAKAMLDLKKIQSEDSRLSRGATIIEMCLIVALIALIAIPNIRKSGQVSSCKTLAKAACLISLRATPSGMSCTFGTCSNMTFNGVHNANSVSGYIDWYCTDPMWIAALLRPCRLG